MTSETNISSFPNNLPTGWKKCLADENNKEYFKKLTLFLKSEYKNKKQIFPPKERVLWAIRSLDYDKVKVVILGQDPYHGEGQALGLSFAVPNSLRIKPPSLKNIMKEIESDLGKKVDPSQSELTHWVEDGVLLLNTVLTVRKSEAFSHKEKGWEQFTDQIIAQLNDRKDPVIFILWGGHARKKKALITNPSHFVIESAHPSPLSAYNGFFGSRPFSKTNALLKKLGKTPVRWEVTG